jgi:hypothetical protein
MSGKTLRGFLSREKERPITWSISISFSLSLALSLFLTARPCTVVMGDRKLKSLKITKLTSSQFHLVFVGRGSLIDETNYKYYETLLLLFPLRKVNTNENTIPRCL